MEISDDQWFISNNRRYRAELIGGNKISTKTSKYGWNDVYSWWFVREHDRSWSEVVELPRGSFLHALTVFGAVQGGGASTKRHLLLLHGMGYIRRIADDNTWTAKTWDADGTVALFDTWRSNISYKNSVAKWQSRISAKMQLFQSHFSATESYQEKSK